MSGTLAYGAFTDYLEGRLLAHTFLGQPWTAPAGLFVSLFLSVPTDTHPGVEPAGGGYSRLPVTFALAPPQADGSSAVFNTLVLQWPPASSDWGLLTGVGVWDAAIGGSMLVAGALIAPKAVGFGDAIRFAANGLLVGLQ